VFLFAHSHPHHPSLVAEAVNATENGPQLGLSRFPVASHTKLVESEPNGLRRYLLIKQVGTTKKLLVQVDTDLR